jgi:hypothetical protein
MLSFSALPIIQHLHHIIQSGKSFGLSSGAGSRRHAAFIQDAGPINRQFAVFATGENLYDD